MNKKLIALLLILVLTLPFSALADGVLKVGMECAYAPFNWSQEDDSNNALPIANVNNMYCNGYDVQVAARIAAALGMELEIYAYEWDSLIPAVQSGALDLIIAGMSPTAQRRETVDFSDIYYTSNLVIITRPGALDGVTDIAGLAGKKIAAQSATSHYDALEAQTTAQLFELADFDTMFIALQSKVIEGYVAEEPTAMAICGGEDYLYIPLVNNETGFTVPVEDTSIAVGLKKGSALLAPINEYLASFSAADRTALMEAMVAIAPEF